MKAYLAFDIGCIECGEESRVIGTFKTRKGAESACAKASKKQKENWEGEHYMQVFEIEL